MTQLADPATDSAADASTEVAQIASDALALVERARFHVRKKGYDPAEVDRFLQECADALERARAPERGGVVPEGDEAWQAFWQAGGDPELFVSDAGLTALLGRARFHLRKKGYDSAEVDAVLGQLHEHGTAMDAALARSRDAADPLARSRDAADRVAPPSHGPAAGPTAAPPAAVAATSPPALAPPVTAMAPGVERSAPAADHGASPTPAGPAREQAAPWDDLVGQVVAASIEGGLQEVARVARLRFESEAMLLRIEQEEQLERARADVQQDCHDLRVAAAEQCTQIVLEAERQAEQALTEIAEGVRAQLAKVCRDAREELERIAADEATALHRSAHDRAQGRSSGHLRVDGPPPPADPSAWTIARPPRGA